MCGIVGFISAENLDRPSLLKAMTDVIAHRGPDDDGTFFDKKAALGFRRLSIIDVAGGHQPLSNTDQSLWIVFNGEIYNYKEVRTELIAKGYSFKTNSDTEVIIHAYQAWGSRCLQKLNGMFAFAIWDTQRERLFIARDRLGVKPLYYWHSGSQFVFGSEIKSLLKFPDAPRQVDPEAINAYMSFLWIPDPHTGFKNIYKLPPGHFAVLENSTLRTECYWDLTFDPQPNISDAQWYDEIRHHLARSVKDRLISEVPLGAFLSGGIDSTAIVAMMARMTDKKISTYTIGFPPEDMKDDVIGSDLEFARLASQKFPIDYHEIIVRPDVADLLPKLVWHMDEPLADPAAITTYLVCKASRETLTVLLSGVGGDEVFGGYPRYLAARMASWYEYIPGFMRKGIISPLIQTLPGAQSALFRNLKKFDRSSTLPFRERYMGYRTYFSEEEKKSLYTHDFQSTLQHAQADPMHEHAMYFDRMTHGDALAQMMYVDIKTFLPCLNLMYTDKMSMATSIEVREPFLDYKLIEMLGRMPSRLKLNGTTRKYAFKKSMEGIVPKEIIWRKKAGFGAPIRSWLSKDLKPMLDDALSESQIAKRQLFNPKAISRLREEEESGKNYNSNQLWQLLCLELWYRQFID